MSKSRIQLTKDLEISRIVHGQMRLMDWHFSDVELAGFIEQCIDLGVTTFDHADIYGNYSCEETFGKALKSNPALKSKIEIVTKCGIKLLSEKYPERTIKHYDYSYDHILQSAEASLNKLNIEQIDLFLLHRPAPLLDPKEVGKAFDHLKTSGKVKHFGVSNFTIDQFKSLQQNIDQKLVTNQVEISPYQLEHFENGNLDFFLERAVHPMAWSPIAGGVLFNPYDEKSQRLNATLDEVAEEVGVHSIDTIIYAWLLTHPSKIIPIVGSGKIERIKSAVESLNIELTTEQWYKIWVASTGYGVA